VNYEDKPIAENKCNGTKPKSTEICDMGSCAKTWFYTEWSDQVGSQLKWSLYLKSGWTNIMFKLYYIRLLWKQLS